MSEFKVGDRVRLEGDIVGLGSMVAHVRLNGDGIKEWHGINYGAMAHATLIGPDRPAIKAGQLWEEQQEAKAPPPLDTSKPMRLKMDHAPVRYLDTGVHGDIWCRTQEGIVCSFKPDALENTPPPKRTMSREVVMISGWHELVYASSCVGSTGKIIARGTITLTEGDGMDEVQS